MNRKVQIVFLATLAVALCVPGSYAKGGGGSAPVGGGQPTHSHMSPAYVDWYMSTHGGHVPVDPPMTGGKPITYGGCAHSNGGVGNSAGGNSGGTNNATGGNNNGQGSGNLFNVPPGTLFQTN